MFCKANLINSSYNVAGALLFIWVEGKEEELDEGKAKYSSSIILRFNFEIINLYGSYGTFDFAVPVFWEDFKGEEGDAVESK